MFEVNHYGPRVNTVTSLVATLLPVALSAAAGLLGVWVGIAATSRRERAARRYAFIEQQLHEFYSPLTGLADEIDARLSLTEYAAQSALEAVTAHQERFEAIAVATQELQKESGRIVKQIEERISRGQRTADHITLLEDRLKELTDFNREIAASIVQGESYKKLASTIVDNRLEEILPLLEESVRIFRERYWLAEESTRRQFVRFNQRVERVRYTRAEPSVTELIPFEDLFGGAGESGVTLLDDLRGNLTMLRERLRAG